MNRRTFIKCASGVVGMRFSSQRATRHLIFVIAAGGMRTKDYLANESLAPNIHRLAREAFVFEEDHCERVASHDTAFNELLSGRECSGRSNDFPTILDYIGDGIEVDSIHKAPLVLERSMPRIIVCRHGDCDVGHSSYEKYLRAVTATDTATGRLLDWVKAHPYLGRHTAIVIRPEFGRDDEVNEHGHLHHSYGFHDTHRVASIFWGPDFNRGVDRKTVIDTLDMAPTLTQLFGVDAIHAQGRVVPGLLKMR